MGGHQQRVHQRGGVLEHMLGVGPRTRSSYAAARGDKIPFHFVGDATHSSFKEQCCTQDPTQKCFRKEKAAAPPAPVPADLPTDEVEGDAEDTRVQVHQLGPLRPSGEDDMEKVDEQALLFMQKSVQANRIKVNTTEVGRRQEDRRKDRDGNRRSTPPRQSGARRRRRASWRRRRRPRKARRPRRSTPSSLQESAFTKGKSCSEQVPDGEIEQTIKESMPGSAAGKTGAVRHPAGLGEGGAGRSDSKHRR